MTKIYVVRHGQDEDNAAGILNGHRNMPLTTTGERQAESLAQKIKAVGLAFDAVYTSPLQRARLTAERIASILDAGTSGRPEWQPIKVQILDELIERNFGVMTGVPTSEIRDRCRPNIMETETITYFLSPQGAETFPDLILRANRVVKHIQNNHPTGSVLLVSHGDFGKMLYAAFYNLEWKEVLRQFHFGNSELLLLSEDSSPQQAHMFEFEQCNH